MEVSKEISKATHLTSSKGEKIIYLCRHGESEDNARPVFQADTSMLTAEGHMQARMLARRVAKIPFDVLIASPLTRAKQTAEAIALETGKNIEYSSLFIERKKPSRIEGKPYGDPEAEELWNRCVKSLQSVDLPRVEDGENFNIMVRRADRALQYLKERPERSIVVVSHGIFIRTMLASIFFGMHLRPQQLDHFERSLKMHNTGCSVLHLVRQENELRWVLWSYGDSAHLE